MGRIRQYSPQQKAHRAMRRMKSRANKHEMEMNKLARVGAPTSVLPLRPRGDDMYKWVMDWLSCCHFQYVRLGDKADERDEKRKNRGRYEKANGRQTNIFTKHYCHSWSEGNGRWPYPLLRPAFVHAIINSRVSKKMDDDVEYWLEQERDLPKDKQMDEGQICSILGIKIPDISHYNNYALLKTC